MKGASYIGCAGWNVPRDSASDFSTSGSHLERYASRFNSVEINSSFYRPHRVATYARWAASVPDSFRFSVKLPRSITHERRLNDVDTLLQDFIQPVAALGKKLGCLLVQLPPSLKFDRTIVRSFFSLLRRLHAGPVVVEPRHSSWFATDVDELLIKHGIGRVGADPPAGSKLAAVPAGDMSVVYFRLHGTPKIYYSTYSPGYLKALAKRLLETGNAADVWCIFDNTARGAATKNALALTKSVTCPFKMAGSERKD